MLFVERKAPTSCMLCGTDWVRRLESALLKMAEPIA